MAVGVLRKTVQSRLLHWTAAFLSGFVFLPSALASRAVSAAPESNADSWTNDDDVRSERRFVPSVSNG
ncbi:hypothetical protein K933_16002 [Candidatus Halobonum tyrrellensis G22]|uniref:Uncharacterized protein n=1 Tax=Candidatus Halobonum tyrrellensis G22 TaxID=1324957 RepID=V4HAF9_9EURY|nr:hypothetical protein K933_16002 [Candidatus Halobonum tyrrellensis G22]